MLVTYESKKEVDNLATHRRKLFQYIYLTNDFIQNMKNPTTQ